MRAIKILLIIFIVPILFQYCSSQGVGTCTAEFMIFQLTVLEPNGDLADSVQVVVKNKITGEEFNICANDESLCNGFISGTYTIMHDGFHGKISEIEERIIVEGTKGELSLKEDFSFRSGVCHVEKLSGPDTVSLALN